MVPLLGISIYKTLLKNTVLILYFQKNILFQDESKFYWCPGGAPTSHPKIATFQLRLLCYLSHCV
jgi:hypothetical protein